MRRYLHLVVILAICVAVCSCRKQDHPPASQAAKRLKVVTTLFPLYDFARTVGGEKVEVTLLLPPGVEPHAFSPRPDDAVTVARADLFIFTNEFMEPWAMRFFQGLGAESALMVNAGRGCTFLKAGPGDGAGGTTGEPEGERLHPSGMDPHIWLDLANAEVMVENIANAMENRDPANKAYYRANATRYAAELRALDNEYKSGLANCSTRVLLHGGHYAFGYLARRYGLRYVSASAVNADAEPSPARLMELVRQVRSSGLRYVFSEELLSPRVSGMIARETGASVLLLHGAHNISREEFEQGMTFADILRDNLAHLRQGLGCR